MHICFFQSTFSWLLHICINIDKDIDVKYRLFKSVDLGSNALSKYCISPGNLFSAYMSEFLHIEGEDDMASTL